MKNLICGIIVAGCVLSSAILLGGCEKEKDAAQPKPLRSESHQRIVFVGDSITDGNTYPTLIRQSLIEAGFAAPVCINSGIGNDVAKGMLARLDDTVFRYNPKLITLSAGVNDSRQTGLQVFEESMDAIAARCKEKGIPLVILTPSTIKASNLSDYRAAALRVAKKYNLTVADINQAFANAATNPEIMETDGVHPNWEGHRLMARVLLDALGYQDVPLSPRLTLGLYEGVITEWKMRPLEKPLNAEMVAELKIDDNWKDYTLPEDKEIIGSWWREDERQRGYATQMELYLGKAPRYVGMVTVNSPKEREVYFNLGVNVHKVWLNGADVYTYPAKYPGWHAGRERVKVILLKGKNNIIIETGKEWFFSITDDMNWS